MILGRVVGEVVATIKHDAYRGEKLLIVVRTTPDGGPAGGYLVAVDRVGAGIGETVLVMDEGNSARQILRREGAPIRSVIVGIVDAVAVAETAPVEKTRPPRASRQRRARSASRPRR